MAVRLLRMVNHPAHKEGAERALRQSGGIHGYRGPTSPLPGMRRTISSIALFNRLSHRVRILEMNGPPRRTTVSSSAAAKGIHLQTANHNPAERASGEEGPFRYAPEPFLPRKIPASSFPLLVPSSSALMVPLSFRP